MFSTSDVRTPMGRLELADSIERLVKHELMMRYDIALGPNVELTIDEHGHLLAVEPYVGVAVLDPLPRRYTALVEAAIYLRDMDGAA